MSKIKEGWVLISTSEISNTYKFDTHNVIFTINTLQLFYNILSTIRTPIVHDYDLKVYITEPKIQI